MDNGRHLCLVGGIKPNLSDSIDVRKVHGDKHDPLTFSRVKTEEHAEVPCKVPRFQYVDFPSLHQCIKQLSVPPLEGWLPSSPRQTIQTHHPSSPGKKVPKFKYVDYPSLYHCIKQLSVPPLEIWSSGITKPDVVQVSSVRQQGSPQLPRKKTDKNLKTNEMQRKSRYEEKSVPSPNHLKDRHQSSATSNQDDCHDDSDNTMQKESETGPLRVTTSDLGLRLKLDKAFVRNHKRPSVINLVRSERQKQQGECGIRVERQRCPDLMPEVEKKPDLQYFCASCQQIFRNRSELQTHWCIHKDKGAR